MLQIGAELKLTIFNIGTILYKDDPDQTSPIEEIIQRAEEISEIVRSSQSKNIIWDHEKLNQTLFKNLNMKNYVRPIFKHNNSAKFSKNKNDQHDSEDHKNNQDSSTT